MNLTEHLQALKKRAGAKPTPELVAELFDLIAQLADRVSTLENQISELQLDCEETFERLDSLEDDMTVVAEEFGWQEDDGSSDDDLIMSELEGGVGLRRPSEEE